MGVVLPLNIGAGITPEGRLKVKGLSGGGGHNSPIPITVKIISKSLGYGHPVDESFNVGEELYLPDNFVSINNANFRNDGSNGVTRVNGGVAYTVPANTAQFDIVTNPNSDVGIPGVSLIKKDYTFTVDSSGTIRYIGDSPIVSVEGTTITLGLPTMKTLMVDINQDVFNLLHAEIQYWDTQLSRIEKLPVTLVKMLGSEALVAPYLTSFLQYDPYLLYKKVEYGYANYVYMHLMLGNDDEPECWIDLSDPIIASRFNTELQTVVFYPPEEMENDNYDILEPSPFIIKLAPMSGKYNYSENLTSIKPSSIGAPLYINGSLTDVHALLCAKSYIGGGALECQPANQAKSFDSIGKYTLSSITKPGGTPLLGEIVFYHDIFHGLYYDKEESTLSGDYSVNIQSWPSIGEARVDLTVTLPDAPVGS